MGDAMTIPERFGQKDAVKAAESRRRARNPSTRTPENAPLPYFGMAQMNRA